MATSLWRPNRHEAYPVLGVEKLHDDGVHADVVVEWASIGPTLLRLVPLSQIEGDCPGLPPTAGQVRSIVRALTADFVDHSAPDRCRCAERAEGQLTPLSPRAQTGAGGEAAPVPNFQKGDVE